MDQAPILPTAGPLLGDVHGCKVEHFKQAVIAGEHRFSFGNLPELAVESFDGISGINELPYLARILEIGRELRPAVSSGFRYFRIFFVPFFSKGVQLIKGRLPVHGSIDLFQISHKSLDILVGDELGTVPYLMDDASLDFRLGENGGNRLRKSCQPINAGNQDILNAAIFQAIHNR